MGKTEPTSAPPTQAQQRRRDAIVQALAQVRLEGLEPDDAFFAHAERYIQGELTLAASLADYVTIGKALA